MKNCETMGRRSFPGGRGRLGFDRPDDGPVADTLQATDDDPVPRSESLRHDAHRVTSKAIAAKARDGMEGARSMNA